MLDTPTGLVTACENDITFLWNDIAAHLDSTDEAIYTKYFLLSSQHSRIPKRAGYDLGYRIAKALAETYGLDDLVKMEPTQLRRLIGDAIKVLSTAKAQEVCGVIP